jgi:hypothetical protein
MVAKKIAAKTLIAVTDNREKLETRIMRPLKEIKVMISYKYDSKKILI